MFYVRTFIRLSSLKKYNIFQRFRNFQNFLRSGVLFEKIIIFLNDLNHQITKNGSDKVDSFPIQKFWNWVYTGCCKNFLIFCELILDLKMGKKILWTCVRKSAGLEILTIIGFQNNQLTPVCTAHPPNLIFESNLDRFFRCTASALAKSVTKKPKKFSQSSLWLNVQPNLTFI